MDSNQEKYLATVAELQQLAKSGPFVTRKPSMLDMSVLTLSPFYPSQRLDVCVERKSSNPLSEYPNHPAFEGAIAWMKLDDLKEMATPVQRDKSRPHMRL